MLVIKCKLLSTTFKILHLINIRKSDTGFTLNQAIMSDLIEVCDKFGKIHRFTQLQVPKKFSTKCIKLSFKS